MSNNKYIFQKNFPKYALKKGMIFQWNKTEGCYTTNSLYWFSTPLVERGQLQYWIKIKWLKKA